MLDRLTRLMKADLPASLQAGASANAQIDLPTETSLGLKPVSLAQPAIGDLTPAKNFNFADRLRIGISKNAIALMLVSGWFKPRSVLLAEQNFADSSAVTIEQIALTLRAMLTASACRGLPTSIVLADTYSRMLMVTPPQNASRREDCRAAAAQRFFTLYGEPASGWQISADWHARRPFLACALPRDLLNMLAQIGAQFDLKLLALTPQFIAAWNRWHRQIEADSWFGVVHADALTFAVQQRRRIVAVRSMPMPIASWDAPDWLPQQLAREALRLNLPAPQRLQMCGALEADWLTRTIGALVCTRLDATPNKWQSSSQSAVALARTGLRR